MNWSNVAKVKQHYVRTFLNHVPETAAVSGKPGLHDVRFVNVSLVSDINVIQEATEQPQTLPNINMSKVS